LKPQKVVMRTKENGRYNIQTLVSAIEVLKIMGPEAVGSVFADSEVLSLINVCGEGTSLTIQEWEFLLRELVYFPPSLAAGLIDARDDNLTHTDKNDLIDFVQWVLRDHPLQGNIRLVNKLLHFVKNDNELYHKLVKPLAAELHNKIEDRTTEVYMKLLAETDMKNLLKMIGDIDRTQTVKLAENKQNQLTGIPPWYKGAEVNVEKSVICRLLLNSSKLNDQWTNLPPVPVAVTNNKKKVDSGSVKERVINYLKYSFFVEFSPTYDDLLAKGYIKVAHALKPHFQNKLRETFGPKRLLFAPIKELQRCKAKIDEYKSEGAKPPYAACVCDFLRATVLCFSLADMVGALDQLTKVFSVVRIKQRINPEAKGNKVILVNLIIDDPSIHPIKYPWSGWWENQSVRMIGEVQIAVESLWYLDKQAHASYEISRTNSNSEWDYQQGFDGIEREMFPMSPLHNNPKCLL